MKKTAFSLVSILTALLISVTLLSCGGGGGGGGGSSGAIAGEHGEPSGSTVYGATSFAYPSGFYKTADSPGDGALWLFSNNSTSALWITDATHAYQVTRQNSTSNVWDIEAAFDIEITNGANGYIRFTNSSATPSRYAYNISDTVLIISNTYHGSKRYDKLPYNSTNPALINR